MSETVSNEIRDEVMSNILANPSNQICFDCGSKAPKWASPYLGIVVCYECAARHRSYGTHISFIRSVDLDKWNRKQLKSLELTGNAYTKERFNDLGIPMIGSIYDYNNSLILKVRQEIADKVKEELQPGEYIKNKEEKKEKEKINFDDEIKEIKKNEIEKKEEKNEKIEIEKKENEQPEEEEQKPQKFQINSKAKVNNIQVKGKAGKKNKIKKVDFDFDFDSFNDVNFSDLNKKEDEEEIDKKDDKKDEEDNDTKEKEEEEKERTGTYNSYDIKLSKEEINKKFKNKKAISSEDYAALEGDNSEVKATNQRIKSMGNSQAISSEDVFGPGESDNYYSGESFGDKIKEMALNFTLGAAEKAKSLKNTTNDLITKVQNKLGGSGY